jgi:16S rRNA (uracil1498-N3)-methyltransferase
VSDPFFFCESLNAADSRVWLEGDEAHHAISVRRLRVDDAVALFNGRGLLLHGTVEKIEGKKKVGVRVLKHVQAPAAAPPLRLACALPKGDRQAVLLDMATQLGMDSFTPLLCERAVVKPGANSLERWQRICLEACKQSRRVFLPSVNEPATLQDVLKSDSVFLLAHPDGETVGRVLPKLANAKTITLLIGPEGGFTQSEVELARARGAHAITLGENILRIEAAAVALLAALRLR